MTKHKDMWRLAQTLHGQFVRHGSADGIELPAEDWRLIEKIIRQMQLARKRGWHLAADRLTPALASAVGELQQCLTEFSGELGIRASTSPAVSATDIYRDLVALRDEFDDVCADQDEAELCVTTTPIVLDGLHLGPFQIRLCWTNLNHLASYRVVALEPYPARTNDQVTHPHVSDETLCEGEGRAAIHAALKSGRIGDFFLLVSQILRTYAAGSAYVELSDWHGNPCSQCGAGVDDDDRYYCQRCDDMLCGDCSCCCAGCDESSCNECLTSCDSCNSRFCSYCLEQCTACNADVCDNCSLKGHCPKCQEDEIHNEPTIQVDHATEVSSVPTAGAAIQSNGLGQTPVSA